MKTTIKFFSMLLLIVSMSVAFTSCGNEGVSKENMPYSYSAETSLLFLPQSHRTSVYLLIYNIRQELIGIYD